MSQDEIEDTAGQATSNLAWFLTGALIGATLAILYTPRSGKDTRRFLSETAQEGREAVAETSKDIVQASREIFEQGRQLVEDAAELFERGRKLVRG